MPIARALGKAISKSLKKSADDSLKPALSESSDLLPPVSKGVEDDVKTFSNVNDFGIEPELVSSLDEDAFSGLKINKENKENWREINKTSQRSGLLPEIETAAEKLYNREISSEDFRNISKELQPITPLKEVPESPSFEDIAFALTDAQVEKGIVGVNLKIKPRERVASRLDIPAYNDYDTWIVSLHDGTKKSGAAIGYAKTAVLDNVDFVSDSNVALDIARKKQLGSGKKMGKATIARIYGDWIPHDSNKAREIASAVFNDPEWIQVGMNPYRASYFYDKADGMPVLKAEQVIQIGPLVLAKKAIKTTPEDLIFKLKSIEGKSDITFAEGGLVPVTSNEGLAPFGVRHSGDSVKGKGWLGAIPNKQGDISTELSAEMQINGKTIEYPLLVPTLTKEEVDYLVSGEPPTQELYDKAESWALSRIKKGKSPFIEQEEIRFPMPSESAKYAKGGDAMYQMKKLFAEGGMMDNSGEVVNGVEVPTGSLRNEVADDIPARLSEGEFVFPADVVRYIGLETLMKLRDKAKQGLSRMEEIGQVGNAEEVSNPDQMFNGEDDENFEANIDEVINEVNTSPQFATGGYVKMSNGGVTAASVPSIVDQKGTGAPSTKFSMKRYTNAAGQTLYVPFMGSEPLLQIPEGYTEGSSKPKETTEEKKEPIKDKAPIGNEGGEGGTQGDGGGGSTGVSGFNFGLEQAGLSALSYGSVLGGLAPYGGLATALGMVATNAAMDQAAVANEAISIANQTGISVSMDANGGLTFGGVPGVTASGIVANENVAAVADDADATGGTTVGHSSDAADAADDADAEGGADNAAAAAAAESGGESSGGEEGGGAGGGAGTSASGDSDSSGGMSDDGSGWAKGGLIKRRKNLKPIMKKRKGLVSRK